VVLVLPVFEKGRPRKREKKPRKEKTVRVLSSKGAEEKGDHAAPSLKREEGEKRNKQKETDQSLSASREEKGCLLLQCARRKKNKLGKKE